MKDSVEELKMTLITMLKLDKHSLIALGDEQSSNNWAKTQDVTKLVKIYDSDKRIALWGATGGTYPIAEIRETASRSMDGKEDLSISDIKDCVRKAINSIKHEKLAQIIESRFPNVELKDIYTGKLKSDDFHKDVYAKLKGCLFGSEDPMDYVTNGCALLGTYDPKEGVSIFRIDFNDSIFYSIPSQFEAVGSGVYGANTVLGPFVAKISRQGRENVPHLDGAIEILHAYNTARNVNRAVGGFPTIHMIKEGKWSVVNDNQAYLAARLVDSLYSPEDYFKKNAPVEGWIDDLIFKENMLDSTLEELAKKSKNTVSVLKFIAGLKDY